MLLLQTTGISNSNCFSLSCSQQLTNYQSALSVLLCIIPYPLSVLLCAIPLYCTLSLCFCRSFHTFEVNQSSNGLFITYFVSHFFRNLNTVNIYEHDPVHHRQHRHCWVAIPTSTRENGVMAFSCRPLPSLAALPLFNTFYQIMILFIIDSIADWSQNSSKLQEGDMRTLRWMNENHRSGTRVIISVT